MLKEKLSLNNNQLKIIAIITMLIDHIGKELLPQFEILNIIGRLAFPIFAFMIAEGTFHTRSKLKYLRNIALLGIGCQTVFFIATNSLYQNILITFSFSIISIICIENIKRKKNFLSYFIGIPIIFTIIVISAIFPKLISGFCIDYGVFGVFTPVVIYFAEGKMKKLINAAIFLILVSLDYSGSQWFSLLALPLLHLYNGERGKTQLKYFFYIFYPLHLVIIYFISLII